MDRNFKQQIINQAKHIDIDKIGFTHAGDFEYLRPEMIHHIEKGYTTGFEHENLDERLNPKQLMNDAKSIISIALAYPSQIKKEKIEKTNDIPRGQIARTSWGHDYHRLLSRKMNRLISLIKHEIGDEFKFIPMVDTGALIDVAVAKRAGLGYIGRNGLLITKEFGSFVFLGEIITNLEIDPDKPLSTSCYDCMKCVKACPGGALLSDAKMNGHKCLSYITQKKGVIPLEYREKIGNVIYGCDICQLVCPCNQGKDFHLHDEMKPVADDVLPDLEALIVMSNKEFKQKYGFMACSWRGKNPIQRNAIYALANMKSVSSIPLLEELASNDPREEIRDGASWAICAIKNHYQKALKW